MTPKHLVPWKKYHTLFQDAKAYLSSNKNDAEKCFAILSRIPCNQYRFGWETTEKSLCRFKIAFQSENHSLRKTQFINFPQVKSLLYFDFNKEKKINLNSTDNYPWTSISWCYVFQSIFGIAIHCNRFQIKFDTKDIRSFIELKRLESSQRTVTFERTWNTRWNKLR